MTAENIKTEKLAGKSVVLLGALPQSLINFRGDLIKDLIAQGAQVTAMAAQGDPDAAREIEALGAKFIPFPVARNGMNPLADVATFRTLRKVLAQLRPDHVLAYTIKPVIYGGLACRRLPSTRFHALITGLGIAFGGETFKKKLLRRLVTGLYRAGLRDAHNVFFQNPENQSIFVDRGIVSQDKVKLVAGTGVNLSEISFAPIPVFPPVFMMVARMLHSKGVMEFAEAARRVKQTHPDWQFEILGPTDTSSDALTDEQIKQVTANGVVKWLGMRNDVSTQLARCHVFVLPSYYPEGRPRTIQEALAVGRPVITTDMPGCRDAIIPDVNGWLVPAKDADALTEAILAFDERWSHLEALSHAARRHAEEQYDVSRINHIMISAIATNDA